MIPVQGFDPDHPRKMFRNGVISVLKYTYLGDHLEDSLRQWLFMDPLHFLHAMDDFAPLWLACAIRLAPELIAGESFLSLCKPWLSHAVPEVRLALLETLFSFTDARRDVACFETLMDLIEHALPTEEHHGCLIWMQRILANTAEDAG